MSVVKRHAEFLQSKNSTWMSISEPNTDVAYYRGQMAPAISSLSKSLKEMRFSFLIRLLYFRFDLKTLKPFDKIFAGVKSKKARPFYKLKIYFLYVSFGSLEKKRVI